MVGFTDSESSDSNTKTLSLRDTVLICGWW